MEFGVYSRLEYKILAATLIIAMAFDIITTIIMLKYDSGAIEMNPIFKHIVNADNPIPMTLCKGIVVIIFLYFTNKAYRDLEDESTSKWIKKIIDFINKLINKLNLPVNALSQKTFFSYSMLLAPTFVTLLAAFFNFWQIILLQ